MAAFMKGYESQTYALLRIVTGFVFLWHGSQKLFGFPGTMPGEAPPFVIWIAGPIELVGGALVMIGLFTRWAGILCIINFVVAIVMVDHDGGIRASFASGCLVFIGLYLATYGAGRFSIDAALRANELPRSASGGVRLKK